MSEPMKPKIAKYLLVSVNEDGEHEIVFVTTSGLAEFDQRVHSFVGRGGVYKLEEEVNP